MPSIADKSEIKNSTWFLHRHFFLLLITTEIVKSYLNYSLTQMIRTQYKTIFTHTHVYILPNSYIIFFPPVAVHDSTTILRMELIYVLWNFQPV